MAEQATSFVDESLGRFRSARERIDDEIQRVQKELVARRKRLERQLASGRKSLERQTRKQVKQLRSEIQGNRLLKRLDALRAQAGQQLESVIETALGTLQIASKTEVHKLDRKVAKLARQLKELEDKPRANGQRPPHAQA
jgi:polyhydroxyalkanoate synthesis regulator phasin